MTTVSRLQSRASLNELLRAEAREISADLSVWNSTVRAEAEEATNTLIGNLNNIIFIVHKVGVVCI